MKVDDLIRVDLSTGITLWWQVVDIHLGAELQEDVVRLVPIGQSANILEYPTLVPAQLLDIAIRDCQNISHYEVGKK